ncbi:hypothetical protein [Sphingomonas sp.]|uniref:hypothetical protein n=1 Tax=Sphingomonas sp. TaxID=28214 RepID=UPI001D3FE1E3|nr:hypothetical protein [Sphingomonas sp.]MBX9795955.1 hypothetical protein [Sphingomonas sp.]
MKRLILAALLLSGCSSGGTDASGAPPSEARQLNDAADMLDEDSVSLNAVSQQPPDNSAKAR